ncbi:MAG: zinc ribbon domain-containing protein [Anaerolineales bacterium]|nr:zinc ribbon domain-containing protein [Anaerolineales bacterium]
MDIGSLFLIVALLILVALFISRPLFERLTTAPGGTPSQDELGISPLLAERDRLLEALHELDFDHALGKIPVEDYPAQRAQLLSKGADILRRLDAVQPRVLQETIAEDRLEAAIAARRADGAQVSGNGRKAARGVSTDIADPSDDLEVMLANRRRVRQEKAAGFCPKCGSPLQKSDLFCPRCGARNAG